MEIICKVCGDIVNSYCCQFFNTCCECKYLGISNVLLVIVFAGGLKLKNKLFWDAKMLDLVGVPLLLVPKLVHHVKFRNGVQEAKTV